MLRFTGNKPNQFKVAFVEAFNRERERVKHCSDARSGAIAVAQALLEFREAEGKETEGYHYKNEHDLINKLVFGATAKELKASRFCRNKPIIEQVSEEEARQLVELRKLDAELLKTGLSFNERKEQLSKLQKHLVAACLPVAEQPDRPAVSVEYERVSLGSP